MAIEADHSKSSNPFLAVFRPYIPASANLRELTPLPLIVGTLLGMVFGASSLYLVLKVGLTVSASIPVAVISITLFRILSKVGMRDATILENNIVQTAGSAGESIAFGVGVTMPAIMILGFDLEVTRVMLVGVLGGLLGILMMIPLRRALIVDQHGYLKYPEGTACAEVLKAGASEESRAAASEGAVGQEEDDSASGAKTIFAGFGVGLIYKVAMVALKGWKDTPEKIFGPPFRSGSVAAEISPELLGVGYIIGPRIASIMCAGGVLAYLVLIPAIKFFGSGMTEPLAPGTVPISEMSPGQIRGAYILYIGAGAVAAGGIISLFRSLPTIWHGLKGGLADLRGSQGTSDKVVPRTDQDMSMKIVVGGIILLIIAIMAFPQLGLVLNILGAILIVAFGFLFVTVSSRLTGEIGSSSNPISGMTVATLLLTCLIFLIVGWTGPDRYVTALSIGAIVCIAASNGGTTSQDLKTGFIVGGTPRLQQIAILVGALASALVLGPILLVLNDNGTVYVTPQTLAKFEKQVTVPATAGMVPYTGDVKPNEPGDYKVLNNEPVPPSKTPPVGDLDPGKYLVDGTGKVMYKLETNFPKELVVPPGTKLGPPEKIKGQQGAGDTNDYHVWQKTNADGGAPPGRYLVNNSGVVTYLADPGINGVHKYLPNGSAVTKYDAPKATLMSYIIKGILNRELPWGLVLLGVMIAIVLEMSGIPSLAFAVGVYLPLSSSSPIFVGGMVRWLVDFYMRKRLAHKKLTEEQLVAEGDKSGGVLMASGYIAGGAIAGIIIAIMTERLAGITDKLTKWSAANNPFFEGEGHHYADALSMIPFIIIVGLLYVVGREWLLGSKTKKA